MFLSKGACPGPRSAFQDQLKEFQTPCFWGKKCFLRDRAWRIDLWTPAQPCVLKHKRRDLTNAWSYRGVGKCHGMFTNHSWKHQRVLWAARDLKAGLVPPPAMCRDTSHQTRFLQALSNPGFFTVLLPLLLSCTCWYFFLNGGIEVRKIKNFYAANYSTIIIFFSSSSWKGVNTIKKKVIKNE